MFCLALYLEAGGSFIAVEHFPDHVYQNQVYAEPRDPLRCRSLLIGGMNLRPSNDSEGGGLVKIYSRSTC
jgi:hypothetical protein